LKTYTPFKKKWLDVRRRLADQGLGNWYGAYIDDILVGDLGLFRDGTIARFQDVGTEVEFRRRGICGTLVYEVSKRALESDDIETLVMVADENYHAARIYESVGFVPTERHASACRYPSK
jgi:ribosomal protein S18 acetylase RimI-like enzyme